MLTERRPGNNEEAFLCDAVDREVAFDAAALVQALGIDHRANGLVDVVGADAVQEGERAGPRTSILLKEVSSNRPAAARVCKCS